MATQPGWRSSSDLRDGRRRSIAQIAGGLPQSRQAVTKHLTVLADAGLIAGERVGREHHFALRPESIGPARDYLDQVARQWDDALARLRRVLEDED